MSHMPIDAKHRGIQRLVELAPVRLVIFGAGVVFVVVVATILTGLLVPPAPSPYHQLVILKNFLLPIAELALYAALVRFLERRPAREVALNRSTLRFVLFGLTLGLVVISAVVLALWSSGFAKITGGTGAEGLAGEILVPFVTAVVEEIIFRAIVFRLAEEMFGTAPAALLSAALFAAAHLGNPGATALTTLCLTLDLGLLLAIAFAASRSLWAPIALHFGWNFALGYVFGTLNSGMSDPHNLLRTTFTGPSWLTGGAFGVEGSVVTLVMSLLLSGGLVLAARRSGVWQPVCFRIRGATARHETNLAAPDLERR